MGETISRSGFLRMAGGLTVAAAAGLYFGWEHLVPSVDKPMIEPRSAWATSPPTGRLTVEEDVRFLLVHHTASSNDYDPSDVPVILNNIYDLHTTEPRSWHDIAYNFIVDRYGTIWEAREGSVAGPVRGDATGGSQGHALLACFLGRHFDEPPTPEAAASMVDLLAWMASTYEVDVRPGATTSLVSRGSSLWPEGETVRTKTIAGHRDMSDTTCPGDAGYQLVGKLQDLVTRAA